MLFPFYDSGRWGYMTAAGVSQIAPRFTSAHPFSEGFALAWRDEEMFVVSEGGGVSAVDPAGALYVEGFSSGLAPVRNYGPWGYVNTAGKWAFPCVYRKVSAFHDGVAVVQNEWELGQHGAIDLQGREIVPLTFHWIGAFGEGVAPACKTPGLTGYIDKSGAWVIAPRFRSAFHFVGGLAAVESESGRFGIIDRTGREVVAADYHLIFPFAEGLAAAAVHNLNPAGHFRCVPFSCGSTSD